jgi:hypothetical protein
MTQLDTLDEEANLTLIYLTEIGYIINKLHLKFCIHSVLHDTINQTFTLLMDISCCSMKTLEQDTVVKYGSARQATYDNTIWRRRMMFTCWITKARKHSHIIFNTN